MIKIENVEIAGWEPAIRVLHSSNNSQEESDSERKYESWHDMSGGYFDIGPNDLNLITSLRNSDTGHWEFMQMITVYLDITAPSYWWREFDACRMCVVANLYSMTHQIVAKEFTLEDFSCEHLMGLTDYEKTPCLEYDFPAFKEKDGEKLFWTPTDILIQNIGALNFYRQRYLETKDKKYWWQMIQLLPSSYNQKRTIMLSYEALANIYKGRYNHKLDEWYEFYKWAEDLPYSELITGTKFLIKGD